MEFPAFSFSGLQMMRKVFYEVARLCTILHSQSYSEPMRANFLIHNTFIQKVLLSKQLSKL